MTDLETLSKSIEELSNNLTAQIIIGYIQGYEHEFELSEDVREELDDIKKIYELGLKFHKNQQKERKTFGFLHDTKEGCLLELEQIKGLYSRATYYRYKKLFREQFGDANG